MQTTQITGANIIAGEYLKAGTQTFKSVNPRQKQASDLVFHNATQDEINQAVEAAVEAFAVTRNYPAEKIAAFLESVADEIDGLGDTLLELTDVETGLGLTRLSGERTRTTNQLRAFAALLREGSYVDAIIDTEPNIRRVLIPMGPVAVFSASNFPYAFAVAGGDTASAFAAGCPVIVKGHPSHPTTSELYAQAINLAIEKHNFPKGFFSLIQGDQIEVGQALVEHPGVAAVGFTGSLAAGRAIYDAAARRPIPIPVYAEMGSINPIVVLPGAIQERRIDIVEGLVNSITLGTGQFCTNPGLILVLDDPQTDLFVRDVVFKMQETEPGVLLNERIQNNLAEAVAATRRKTDLLIGGNVIEGEKYCFEHTVLKTDSTTFRAEEDLQVEHFGPVTLFVVCDSVDDMEATIRHLHGNLAASIHAADSEIEDARRFYDLLKERAGRLIWNGFPTGVAVVYSMQHGGPYPATTAPQTTSVGMTAINRWLRPVAYQGLPDTLLPPALQDANPLGIWRIVDNELTREPIE